MKKFRFTKEDGSADLISVLIMLPMVVFLLFTMIDVSLYLNSRAVVEAANRDGVRQVALWGGTTSDVRVNNSKKSAPQIIVENLGEGASAKCVIDKDGNESTKGDQVSLATSSGQKIICETTYQYNSVAAGVVLPGLSEVINAPIKVKHTGYTEVGYS